MSVNYSLFHDAQHHLNAEDADSLFGIYRNYLEKTNKDHFFAYDHFSSKEECPYDWDSLDVDFSIETIQKIANESGVVQLRQVDPSAKVLVVGCGNKPLADSAGCPTDKASEYSQKHAHEGAVTINPQLANNPTIVAFFGEHSFPMLKSHQFDLIIIEGTSISDTPIGREELSRLVSKTGQVVQDTGDRIGLQFSWENNSANVWDPSYVKPPVVIPRLPGYELLHPCEKKPLCCTIL